MLLNYLIILLFLNSSLMCRVGLDVVASRRAPSSPVSIPENVIRDPLHYLFRDYPKLRQKRENKKINEITRKLRYALDDKDVTEAQDAYKEFQEIRRFMSKEQLDQFSIKLDEYSECSKEMQKELNKKTPLYMFTPLWLYYLSGTKDYSNLYSMLAGASLGVYVLHLRKDWQLKKIDSILQAIKQEIAEPFVPPTTSIE